MKMIQKKHILNKPEILQEDLTIPLTIDKTKKQLKNFYNKLKKRRKGTN